MKYIIKNCPQCIEYTDGANRFFICQTTNTYCQITEDCLLKRIVEKCEEVQFDTFFEKKLDEYNPIVAHFAKQILAELESEEVNE